METQLSAKWTPKRLRALMEKLGMARVIELAVAVGVHQMTAQRWVTGTRHPRGAARLTLERLEAECRDRKGAE